MRASPIVSSFNTGEVSPLLEGRVDVAKYAAACKHLEGFIPTIQGPAKRRGGFRYVGEVKDSTSRSWLVKFEFNTQQAYVLEFGNQYIRFWANHGQVVVSGVVAWATLTVYAVGDLVSQGGINYYCKTAHTAGVFATDLAAGDWYALTGAIYEIPSPYTTADLTNSDGTFALRFVESADIIYIAHRTYQQRKLSRLSATKWTLAAVQATGGPFKTENTTATTVYANGLTGSVTLFASSAIFQAGHVGSLFRMQPQDFTHIPPWEGYTEVANGTGGTALGLRRRSVGKNYICTTDYTITGAAAPTNSIRTGTDKLTHTTGTARDGAGTSVGNVAELVGLDWQYTDPGYGIVLITGFTSSTQVTATVVAASSTGIAQLPYFVTIPTGAGAYNGATTYGRDVWVTYLGNTYRSLKVGNIGHTPSTSPTWWVLENNFGTTRWAFADWSDVEGWPSHVGFFRERLIFGRSQRVWMSVAGDYENFSKLDDSGQVAADMAITIDLQSTQVNNMLWMETFSPSIEALMIGTAGSEFVVKSQTENNVFGPDNVTAAMVSTYGSRNMQPKRVGNIILYAQRAGLKLRDLNYDFYSSNDGSNDQSILAEHLTRPGLSQIDYQQEPYSIMWGVRSDGGLLAMTYSREQYPEPPHGGWHQHPVAGGLGAVEAICVIPAPDQTRDEVWAITRFTVNGSTKRYVGYMDWERRPGDDPEDSFYVDYGLTLDNTAAYITGSGSCTLSVSTGDATVKNSSVLFLAGAAIWSGGDVGRQIHYRYTYTGKDNNGLPVTLFGTAKATITQFIDSTHVYATINAAWPSNTTVAATSWRMSVTTISGLGYLEGMTVDVLANGATHPQRVVSGGQITLQTPASKVQVGLPMPARLQTVRMNAGAGDGTSQGKLARINKMVVRLHETLGLQHGTRFDTLDTMDFRYPFDPMDNPPALFTGDKIIDWTDDYDTEPWACFQQTDPLPCTIVALMPQVVTQDRG